MPRALVTGITGQDGSYLAEQLLAAGVVLHGFVRGDGLGLAEHLRGSVTVHRGDLRDDASVAAAVRDARPHRVFHLGAATHVAAGDADPEAVHDLVAGGTRRVLEAVAKHAPGARLLCASSAEVFGDAERAPQDERTELRPRNAYGEAKAEALRAARQARADGLWVSCGIFYNHESPRRPQTFVSRKVTWHAAAIARGRADELRLGALDARRDWGYAPDYMDAARRALEAPKPGDYVIATGVLHSVRDLVDAAFARAGVPVDPHVIVDPDLVRPPEPVALVGDSRKAAAELGWSPTRTFEEIVAEMVDADLEALAA